VGDDSVINWTASVTSGASWLSVSPASGTTDGAMTVTVNTLGLSEGSHSGEIEVDGGAGTLGSPQTITVDLAVTAPLFAVTPGSLDWFYEQNTTVDYQDVEVIGANLNWYAGVVPMDPLMAKALAAGATLERIDGGWLLNDGTAPLSVPVIDWIDILPSHGTATVGGTDVRVGMVPDKVPAGYHNLALVFVTEGVASPRAAVVDLTVLAYNGGTGLTFIPVVEK